MSLREGVRVVRIFNLKGSLVLLFFYVALLYKGLLYAFFYYAVIQSFSIVSSLSLFAFIKVYMVSEHGFDPKYIL